jgi:hypothetical protein
LHNLHGGSGATGIAGQDGVSGPTGATGAFAAKPFSEEFWHAMPVGSSTRGTISDSLPACTQVAGSEKVFLRGHITLLLTSGAQRLVGQQLLAVLPAAPGGSSCACQVGSADVVATSTSFLYPTGALNNTQVCIVRLLVSKFIPMDVNQDGLVSVVDENLIRANPSFDSGFPCQSTCGLHDLTRDGFIDQRDVDVVKNSVAYGTNVSCGAVFVTSLSCGAERSAPASPAVAISLDQIRFLGHEGRLSTTLRRRGTDSDSVDVEFAVSMLTERMERNNYATQDSLEQLRSRVVASQQMQLLSRVDLKHGQAHQVEEEHQSSKRMLLVDVLTAIGTVVLASAIAAFAMRKLK